MCFWILALSSVSLPWWDPLRTTCPNFRIVYSRRNIGRQFRTSVSAIAFGCINIDRTKSYRFEHSVQQLRQYKNSPILLFQIAFDGGFVSVFHFSQSDQVTFCSRSRRRRVVSECSGGACCNLPQNIYTKYINNPYAVEECSDRICIFLSFPWTYQLH